MVRISVLKKCSCCNLFVSALVIRIYYLGVVIWIMMLLFIKFFDAFHLHAVFLTYFLV